MQNYHSTSAARHIDSWPAQAECHKHVMKILWTKPSLIWLFEVTSMQIIGAVFHTMQTIAQCQP